MNQDKIDMVKDILNHHIMHRDENDEPTVECGCCERRIVIGEDITYDHMDILHIVMIYCAVNGDDVTF